MFLIVTKQEMEKVNSATVIDYVIRNIEGQEKVRKLSVELNEVGKRQRLGWEGHKNLARLENNIGNYTNEKKK